MLILYIFLVSKPKNCWFQFVSTAPTWRDIFLLVLFKEIFSEFLSASFELLITLVEDVCMRVKLLQSRLTLCDPMDCSPPGSSVQGILWEGILEWVAMPVSRESSQSRDRTLISYVSSFGRWVLYH